MTLTTDRPSRSAAPRARVAQPAARPRTAPVYVVLLGSVYTSVEIAQCLDLTVALDRLRAARA